MEKIDCIENYFAAIRAYCMYQIGRISNIPEYKDYILDKYCLNGTKVAFISNLMLAIKEDLVDNKGNMEYESKIFLQKLENSVNLIATKVVDGYKLSNYVFPDAATLVAIVRNKLAHGKYKIDFQHNRVILEHKGVDIIINIDKLCIFVLSAFGSGLKNKKSNKYERNIMYYTRVNTNRTERVKDLSEVKKIIKNFNYVSFTLESLDGKIISEDCILFLEGFIKKYGMDVVNATKSDYYKNLVSYLKQRNCKLNIETKTLRDKEEIEKIMKYIGLEILNNDNLSYMDQLRLIGLEVQKSINQKYRTFDAVVANIGNLIITNAIDETKSVNDMKINSFISNIFPYGVKFGYDEFAVTLLAMFNALFLYPFDDVYDTSGEYTSVRNDVLDFSTLDLSMVNPNIITIDDSPLLNAKEKLDGLVKKQVQVVKKIMQQEHNLTKVSGNTVAENSINSNLNDLRNTLSKLITDYMLTENTYKIIKEDYSVNSMYFRNKAIIEGIRNSIAHGHYEFVSNGDVINTEIIFSDIYEGKITFQVKMTFNELFTLIEENYGNVLSYVKNKSKNQTKKLV